MGDVFDREFYGPLVHGWVASEMAALYGQHVPLAPKGTILLGGVLWGPAYIQRFLKYTARTLLSPRNAKALKGHARIVIYTEAAGFDFLWSWARKMQSAGFPTQIALLPQELMDGLARDKNNKYMLLGAVQNLLVQVAARNGAAFGVLFPDMLYSENYFHNLLRLGRKYPAIAHSNISAGTSIYGEAEKFAQGDALSIPAVDLGDLGWRNIHQRSSDNLANKGREWLGYPSSHCLIWQGRDRLTLHCCHTNASFMSAELCQKAPVRFFSPIDCNLPYLMGDDFYVPTLRDDMTMVEVSEQPRSRSAGRLDAIHFAATCWYHTNFRDEYLPYFRKGNDIPIRPQAEYMEAADIAARQAAVVETVIAHKPLVQGRIKFKEAA